MQAGEEGEFIESKVARDALRPGAREGFRGEAEIKRGAKNRKKTGKEGLRGCKGEEEVFGRKEGGEEGQGQGQGEDEEAEIGEAWRGRRRTEREIRRVEGSARSWWRRREDRSSERDDFWEYERRGQQLPGEESALVSSSGAMGAIYDKCLGCPSAE